LTIEGGSKNEVVEALKRISSVDWVNPLSGTENRFEIQSRAHQSSRREIFNTCVANKWILTEMSIVETKLEDIFHELTMN